MLFNSYSYEILYEQFYWICLQGDIKLLLVTVNNRLKFEIKIVHYLSCHPIVMNIIIMNSLTGTGRMREVWFESAIKYQLTTDQFIILAFLVINIPQGHYFVMLVHVFMLIVSDWKCAKILPLVRSGHFLHSVGNIVTVNDQVCK